MVHLMSLSPDVRPAPDTGTADTGACQADFRGEPVQCAADGVTFDFSSWGGRINHVGYLLDGETPVRIAPEHLLDAALNAARSRSFTRHRRRLPLRRT